MEPSVAILGESKLFCCWDVGQVEFQIPFCPSDSKLGRYVGGKLFKSKFKSQTDHPGGWVVGWSNLILYPTLALIRAQLGFRIEVEDDRLTIRVGGWVGSHNDYKTNLSF